MSVVYHLHPVLHGPYLLAANRNQSVRFIYVCMNVRIHGFVYASLYVCLYVGLTKYLSYHILYVAFIVPHYGSRWVRDSTLPWCSKLWYSEPSSLHSALVRLISPSSILLGVGIGLIRRRTWWATCMAADTVKFDSNHNLGQSVHTVLVVALRSCLFELLMDVDELRSLSVQCQVIWKWLKAYRLISCHRDSFDIQPEIDL